MPETHKTTLLNTLWEFTRGEDKEGFIEMALKMCKAFKVKSLKRPKLDIPAKKTAYTFFHNDMRQTKLQGVTVSQVSAIISKEWKKVKASEEKMKKYMDLYEVEKQRYEEALQRYQEDHMDQMEIINLQKRCNKKATKTGTKADRKKDTKTGAKAASKGPRSGYHLFMRE